MEKIQELNECGRGEQLVAYLYGESGAGERAAFEGHLSACAACRQELAAFGQVREAVGAWRAELLTHAPALSTAEVIPAATQAREDSLNVSRGASASRTRGVEARRSPWAALREFFALSPVWLRYGSAAALLVVCALAALAVANARVTYSNGGFAFSTGWSRDKSGDASARQTLATGSAQSAQADGARLEQLAAERDAALRELQETRAQLEDSRASNIEAVYREIDEAQPGDAPQPAPAVAAPTQRARRGATAQRRAARRAPHGEDDLPRLIDLLGSGN